ncbi:LOG family protein [Elstera litoralis]|uniref:LOG family protein n=1 Tax=Elstera litoralis TaxID=552518 RepID=UPI000697A732|nr:TIGR00730 family Rossman fold protein [Elstera litoralis]
MTSVKTVCVYCGSSGAVDPAFRDAATDLGKLLADAGMDLVYGGGRVGLMGLVADGVMANGGRVIGIIPEFLDKYEVGHTGLSELIVVDNMHTRKKLMMDRADAFVVLPGGFGTLEELFEVLTWKQLRLHDKPILLLDLPGTDGRGFWEPLTALLDHLIAEKFAKPEMAALWQIVTSLDGVLPAFSAAPPPTVAVETKWL